MLNIFNERFPLFEPFLNDISNEVVGLVTPSNRLFLHTHKKESLPLIYTLMTTVIIVLHESPAIH